MKVLHLAFSDSIGGAAKAGYRIHLGLRQLGIDSWMYVARKLTSDDRVLCPQTIGGKSLSRFISFLDGSPIRFFGGAQKNLLSPAWIGLPLGRVVRKLRPEIIQLHWTCAGFMRIESIKSFGIPIVWRLADMWAFCGGEHYCSNSRYRHGYARGNRPSGERGIDLNRWVWGRKKTAYEYVKNLTVVAPSKWLLSCAQESFLFKNRRCVYIPTGHNTSVFFPRDKDSARKALGLPLDKKVVMFCSGSGINETRKGFDLFCRAMNCDGSNDIETVVVGKGNSDSRYSFPTQPSYFGEVQDEEKLSLIYSAADVLVAPSLQDNLPNTAIEAMACGTPVAAFNIGGLPDIICHKETGFLAKAGDVEDLAEGINWILSDVNRWGELSKKARESIAREHSIDMQAQRYRTLYEEVRSGATPAPP